MSDGITVSVDGADKIGAVADVLGREEHQIPDDAVQAIRDEAEILAARARERVREEPALKGKHTGLRDAIAAGTKVDPTQTGASVSASLDGERRNLPFDMDSGAWEHPVFGNENKWVHEVGFFPWFSDTMSAGEDDLQKALEDVLDRAAERIAAA